MDHLWTMGRAAGTLAATVALSFVALPAASAQDAVLGGLKGRVIADGRPINFLVEVRLDNESLGKTVATAYTLGSEEFEFADLPVNSRDSYFLVIEHDGYEAVRYRVDSRDFWRDPRNRTRLGFAGVIVLYLTARTEEAEPAEPDGSSRVVDVRQLTAVIPGEAREAYEAALDELKEGRDLDGLRHLERAVDLAPDYYDALNKLGIEYLKGGRYRDAQNSLDRARALGPNDPRPLANLGMLHFHEAQTLDAGGETDEAAASYRTAVGLLEEAVRLDPLMPESNFYLGSALYETGAFERAESILVRALELDERLYDARLTLLNVYTRLERYDEALVQIAAYIEANPDSPRRRTLEAVREQIEGALESSDAQ